MPTRTKTLKYLVIFYNIILAISGFAVFLLNCIFLYQFLRYNQFLSLKITAPAITLVVVGLVSCLVAWIGWRAACTLHRFHVIVFGFLLLLIVVTQFGVSIWSLVVWDNLKDQVTSFADLDFLAATEHKHDPAIKRWERLQTEMQCCGVGGNSDYRASSSVPWSCCAGAAVGPASTMLGGDCSTVHQRGCLGPLVQMVKETMLHVCFTALGAGLLQGTGLLCTFYLVVALGRPTPRRPAPPPPVEEGLLAASPKG